MIWPGHSGIDFFLDPGHMSAMLYSIQALLGNYSMEDLKNFRQWGSPTPGHPERDISRGIENTSGPLGCGHTFGVGAAMAERFLTTRFGEWMSHRTYLYISDGGIQEEISQGAGRTAGFLGLGNIIMFYDANDIQLSTEVGEVMTEDTAKKYEAWGWHVLTIPGNDHDAIRKALQAGIEETDRPTLIIGKTTMAKGAVTEDGSSYEGTLDTHGKPLGKTSASITHTLKNLGADPDNPFQIYPEVKEYFNEILTKKRDQAKQKKALQTQWANENPDLDAKLTRFLNRELPEMDFSTIEQKENIPTRNASAAVLSYLADHVENMVVASADLSNSDKTDAFLKKTHAFQKGDFSGAFYQAGVSEFTMAAICTGMALHGGVIPACGTFFVFSDFQKPALRLAALMQVPVIFIWTHDAFRVGEDGPTHQPIEQEAQIRLLEKLQNHAHKRSFTAIRPADAQETTVAWKIALENQEGPTGLILSRQNVNDVPAESGTRYEEACKAVSGAYVIKDAVQPDVVLLANGSEVSTLVEGAKLLEEDGLKVKIVSAPSEGIFRDQSQEYQDSVIPSGFPIFGLTAGLPVTLEGLVGPKGHVSGMTHFGYSAPYTVLDEKFGYTAESVYQEVKAFLG